MTTDPLVCVPVLWVLRASVSAISVSPNSGCCSSPSFKSSLRTTLPVDFISPDMALWKSPPIGARDLRRGLFGGCLGSSVPACEYSALVGFPAEVQGPTGSSFRLVPFPSLLKMVDSKALSWLSSLSSALTGPSVLVLESLNAKVLSEMALPKWAIGGTGWERMTFGTKLKEDGVLGAD